LVELAEQVGVNKQAMGMLIIPRSLEAYAGA
jgi:hypothetical protein